jgi:MFS family permease
VAGNRVLYGLFRRLDKPYRVKKQDRLDRTELRTAAALASIFFLRMLGLFMLLPVLALYGARIEGATPLLIGAALGIYGLTQAALQIPMGRWSDRIGRKPVIAIGLVTFTIGGIVAALSGHIFAILAGRALQGAGAISGAVLALASDLTRPQHRTAVMALIGISIGLAFSAAFVLGPWLDSLFGLAGLFWVAAALGVAALPILIYAVPNPPGPIQTVPGEVRRIAWPPAPELLSLYVGVFCLHGILAASFISIPLILQDGIGLESGQHYSIYIPVLIISLLCVAPMIMLAHRAGVGLALFRIAIGIVIIGELVLWLGPLQKMTIVFGLTAFFIGFNFLEASLPSMVSRAAPEAGRGGALGTYSTAQFIGLFAGGLGGGALSGAFGFRFVFAIAAIVGGGWLIYSLFVPNDESTDTDPSVG